ncbi:hypothetical protein [Sediminibacillus massiliensis]|uniref:hypothetical protein n=1 Tax=Sediminibacillus massiliensis TaxID=1926277 RepID=UPI00098842A3|nr:hypothetical protein [Sediminibacillus massiliensis]
MIKIKVLTHSGDDVTVEVEDFDSKAFIQEVNEAGSQLVELGGETFSGIDIKGTRTIEEEEETSAI